VPAGNRRTRPDAILRGIVRADGVRPCGPPAVLRRVWVAGADIPSILSPNIPKCKKTARFTEVSVKNPSKPTRRAPLFC